MGLRITIRVMETGDRVEDITFKSKGPRAPEEAIGFLREKIIGGGDEKRRRR